MELNDDFFEYIKTVLIKLREVIGEDFVVFGSAPLYLLGVVDFNGEINDLDISIKNENSIPKNAKRVTFHKNQKKYFYKIEIEGFQIDLAPAWEGQEDQFNKIFQNPIVVNDFKFANLDVVEGWKKEMVKKFNRQKDIAYLKKIEEYRNRIN